MKKISMLFIIFIILLSVLFADEFSDKIAEEEIKLQALRERMKEAAQKTDELKKSEKNILGIILRMNDELSLTQRLLKSLKNKEKIISEEIDKTEKIIQVLEDRRKERSKILNKRIRAVYKKGKMHTFEILLTSRTFIDAIKRFEYLTIIAQQDKKIFNELVDLKKDLEEKKKFLRTNLDEIKKINIEAEKETEFLSNKKKDKQGMLESVKAERAKQEQLTRELKASARKITSLIDKLERERKEREKIEGATNYFENVVGKIKFPVKGKLISTFGNQVNPKYGTTVKNNGIDLKAPRGAPVHSIAKGKIVYNDRFLGYGNVILIDHGKGYYSLYAHLQDVNVSLKEIVEKDQVVGTVGDTGSLEGPKLHFEIRKNGKPIDPLPFLKENR
ncbi:peptidoglycan DD-metalloendopeptidase family protein [candidate division WOR-3 bacterium]|nr:peptidoglycan DD-metalloendopeptidase family protein [candidate division WOR-3 bacterium]